MAEEKEKETEAEVKPSKKSDPNKIIMGLLVLNLVFMGGVAAVVMMAQKKQDAAQSISKLVEGAAASGEHGEVASATDGEETGGFSSAPGRNVRFYNVGEFTANLSGPGAAHFVRVNVNFELDKKLDEEEMKKRTPQIRDKIITLLNSKRPKDLQHRDGRVFLKEEIRTSINGVLQTGEISGVYFSSFIFE